MLVLFSVHLLILHFKFQFSKFIKSSTFHIFVNLTNLSFLKIYLFPKMAKNHPKIYTKPPNSGYLVINRDLALLEAWTRYWQKGRVKRRQNSLESSSMMPWRRKAVPSEILENIFLYCVISLANFRLKIYTPDTFHAPIGEWASAI